jgi:hypothetical protein
LSTVVGDFFGSATRPLPIFGMVAATIEPGLCGRAGHTVGSWSAVRVARQRAVTQLATGGVTAFGQGNALSNFKAFSPSLIDRCHRR